MPKAETAISISAPDAEITADGVTAWLEWYRMAGVEEGIADTPMPAAWLPAEPPVKATAKPTAERSAAPLPRLEPLPVQPYIAPQGGNAAIPMQNPRASAKQAGEMAQKALTLAELHDAIRAFDGCALKRTATNTVIADGVPDNGILLIGEAPGSEEDARGIPFCGPSGKLLDKMLKSIGLNRQNSYITNSLYWRPPGNRKPSTEELQSCQPFVWRHIELIKPKIVIMVGGTSASSLLDTPLGITRLRGKQHQLTTPGGASVPAFALYHPSYLLRQPSHKRYAWHDLLQIKGFLS
ncbi:uracil-DNA glycosylase [bacterium]|nr:uracil-DNA glycosylase [bacterium]